MVPLFVYLSSEFSFKACGLFFDDSVLSFCYRVCGAPSEPMGNKAQLIGDTRSIQSYIREKKKTIQQYKNRRNYTVQKKRFLHHTSDS